MDQKAFHSRQRRRLIGKKTARAKFALFRHYHRGPTVLGELGIPQPKPGYVYQHHSTGENTGQNLQW